MYENQNRSKKAIYFGMHITRETTFKNKTLKQQAALKRRDSFAFVGKKFNPFQ